MTLSELLAFKSSVYVTKVALIHYLPYLYCSLLIVSLFINASSMPNGYHPQLKVLCHFIEIDNVKKHKTMIKTATRDYINDQCSCY